MIRMQRCALVLAVLAPASAGQSVAFGYGPGLFDPEVIVAPPVWGSPATGDLNEDGRADLVVPGQSLQTILRFLGDADGGLGEAFATLVMPDPFGPFPLPLLGELDGDGHLDLLVKSTAVPLALTLPGLGDGSFAAPLQAGAPPVVALGVSLADLDGDHVLDLVFSRGGLLPHHLEWMQGQGNGTFGAPTLIATATQPTALLVADLDGDATADLLCLDSGHVDVRLGLGGGSFGPPQSYSSFAFSGLDAADMDLDGQLDVVHGGSGDAASILHGAGDGSFGAPSFVQMASPLLGVGALDIERDGLPDLLGAVTSGGIVARRMDRDGPIGGPVVFPFVLGLLASPIVRADFDGDGWVDVAVSDFQHHALFTLENALGAIVDLGLAVSSAQGTPSLTASGTPKAGRSIIVDETWATFPSLGVLVVGLAPDNLAFQDGALVPCVDVLLPLMDSGTTTFQTIWPAGIPAGVPIYLQSLRATAGAGKALSRALVLMTE
jgi:FG-GAP-like repeat